MPDLSERVTPLATDELSALQEKWPRIYAAVVSAEARAEAAERRLSQAEEVIRPFADEAEFADRVEAVLFRRKNGQVVVTELKPEFFEAARAFLQGDQT